MDLCEICVPEFGHHRCIDLSIKGGVGGTPTNRGGLEGGGRNARKYIGFGQGACGKQHSHQIATTFPAYSHNSQPSTPPPRPDDEVVTEPGGA